MPVILFLFDFFFFFFFFYLLCEGVNRFVTLMFSATDDPKVAKLSQEAFLYRPIVIDLTADEEQATVSQLQQGNTFLPFLYLVLT